jgi:hypothetical protein
LTDVRVIGHFFPSEFKAETIETEIRKHLPPCCAKERISVRIPDARVPVHPDNLEWHQDGGGKAGTTQHMVVWASEMPTEILRENGTDFKGGVFDVVLFDNWVVFHRQPRGTDEGSRWFVSVRCSGELK